MSSLPALRVQIPQVLADALDAAKTLTALHLGGNCFDDACAAAFAQALVTNESILLSPRDARM